MKLPRELRQRLLTTDASYLEVDAVHGGVRWLPRCLETLSSHAGVAWTSTPAPSRRLFRGWAFGVEGPLPRIPWDLGAHGTLDLDLDLTLKEAVTAAGLGI